MFALESTRTVKFVPKWNDDYFSLPRGKKVKVILACQIFSHTAAAATRTYVVGDLLSPEAKETATFMENVNALWDFIDSHSLNALMSKRTITAVDYQHQEGLFASFIAFTKRWHFRPRISGGRRYFGVS